MNPVRVGLVGAGEWATANHLPVLTARDDVDVVAVCDVRPEAVAAARDRFGIGYGTADLDDLLARDLDAVVVATPNAAHHGHALAALRAGHHVLVEKPIAGRAAQAWQLVAEARARDRHLMVPLGYNFLAPAARAREQVASGALGRLELVTVHIASPMRAAVTSASARPGAGGVTGYSYAQLPHALGLALWITGLSAERVHAEYGPPEGPAELADAMSVRFAGGAAGVVSGTAFSGSGHYHHAVRVYGSDGFLALDTEVGRERLHVVTPAGSVDERLPPGSGEYDGTRPVHAFVELVRGASSRNDSSGELSARVIELLEAAARSSGSARPVKVR